MLAEGSAAGVWQQLSRSERALIAPKLGRRLIEEGGDPAAAFLACLCERQAAEAESGDEIAARLQTVRNFLAQTGAYGDGPVWRQIAHFRGFRRSYLELVVHDRDRLLGVLRAEGYRVGREPRWSIHRFDSARAMTRYADEPSLHFANDRADEEGYGPNYFFVHWDATSVCFREVRGFWRFLPGARWIGRLRAGLRHRDGFAEPAEVQDYLINGGVQHERFETEED